MVAVALALLVAAVISLVQMNREVRQQIDALATANSDSTQWSLAQADVELLALLVAISDARLAPEAPLSEVRNRFDVFYSRAQTLAVSPMLAEVRRDSGVDAALDGLERYLAEAVALVDAEDAVLRAALPGLAALTDDARDDVREINLSGVSILSLQADAQRASIAETLGLVSLLTFTLFVVLIITVLMLLLSFRRARQQADEQSQIRSRLAAMVSSSLDAVIAVNTDGKVIAFNGAAEQIFGYSQSEALGQQMDDLIVPDHLKAAHRAGMDRYHGTGEKRVIGKGRIQLEARRKSGEVFPVELSVATSDSEDGEIFVAFLRDISRRLTAERELIKARDVAVAGEKAKADLIAVMSHEMRTPLNGMLGTLDLLDAESHSPKDRDYIDIIRASGKLLLHHVDNVLDISRAEAGKIDIAATAFSMPALVRELVESQRGVAEHRGNTLHYRLDMQGREHAVGDPTRIRQVLLNLVGNAVKFTRNGSITIDADRLGGGDMVEFRVTDTGIGIPEADRERIFEDFVTLDPSLTRAVGGTGLGLAIVRRLVRAMGGEVGLETTEGHGSSFWVRLPLPCPEAGRAPGPVATEAPELAAGTAPVPPMKILVVEDNQINRLVVRDMLEVDGHEVHEAHDGEEGVAQARRISYDLVLMDISMPKMDGVEATRAIRAAEPAGTHLPIVALTAHAIPSEKERFLAAGIDDVLTKPISLNSVREVLRRVSARLETAPAAPPQAPGASAIEGTMLNHAHLEELAGILGAARVGKLIESFLAEMDAAVADIAASLVSGHVEAGLRAKVHHAAGSAALLGAEALQGALADLETALAEGRMADAASRRSLDETWRATAPELRLRLPAQEAG
ncbi:MAG: ATP-binding protein [Roseovarius sp.]